MKKSKLFLIPGATGRMGQEYFNLFSKLEDFEIKRFTSNKSKVNDDDFLYCDFLDKDLVDTTISNLNIQNYEQIYLLHSIGPFLFEEGGIPHEDNDKDGIDDMVYKLNYLTFENVSESIIRYSKDHQKIILCAFGSISDRFVVPWWQSYSKSKNILREFILSTINKNIRGVFINISSTEKDEERPFADKAYWLSTKEVVERSKDSILNNKLNYQEIFIIKPNPNYDKNYFHNLEKLKTNWIEQIFGKK